MGIRRSTDEGVIMTAGAVAAAYLNQQTMIRGVRAGMGALPGVGVTGRTVATSSEGLAVGKADGAAIHIVTAGADVVGIQGGAGQGVIMTAATGAAGHGHQAGVNRSIGTVDPFPGPIRIRVRDVTGRTIATTGRYGRLQRRTDRMAVGTEAIVSGSNRAVYGGSGIVTIQAWGGTASDIA